MGGGAMADSLGEGAVLRPATLKRRWTIEEDALFEQGLGYAEIAKLVGRTLAATQVRGATLRRGGRPIQVKVLNGGSWANWSETELNYFFAGFSDLAISRMTGRNLDAVKRQRFRVRKHEPSKQPLSDGTEWWLHAACRRHPQPEIFFADESEPELIALAKETCAGCSVKADCLAYARQEKFGIWGGLTARERGVAS